MLLAQAKQAELWWSLDSDDADTSFTDSKNVFYRHFIHHHHQYYGCFQNADAIRDFNIDINPVSVTLNHFPSLDGC